LVSQIFTPQQWALTLESGSGLIYVPAVSIVSIQFTGKRAVALGLAATGSAVGGVILPIIFRSLLARIGFGWTNRVFATILLGVAVLSFTLLTEVHYRSLPQRLRCLRRQNRQAESSRRGTSSHAHFNHSGHGGNFQSFLSAFKGRAYVFLCAGVFLIFLGYWVPLFYIVPFAVDSLDMSSSHATYLLAILNAESFLGRALPPFLGEFIGTANVLLLGAVGLGSTILSWLSIGNIPSIMIWCFVIG
jgi:Na+/melibiose symporter-like transporter